MSVREMREDIITSLEEVEMEVQRLLDETLPDDENPSAISTRSRLEKAHVSIKAALRTNREALERESS